VVIAAKSVPAKAGARAGIPEADALGAVGLGLWVGKAGKSGFGTRLSGGWLGLGDVLIVAGLMCAVREAQFDYSLRSRQLAGGEVSSSQARLRIRTPESTAVCPANRKSEPAVRVQYCRPGEAKRAREAAGED
jgi:hypothetical protein